MKTLEHLAVKIYADGADVEGIRKLAAQPLIQGLTTNPTLMRAAGIKDYEAFAREVLAVVPDKPISFEVFSDDFPEMRRQALKLAGWGPNVYVKIPITNTRDESALPLVAELAREGVKINLTAVLTEAQIAGAAEAFAEDVPAVLSVFAGRIADTGVDPMPVMAGARKVLTAARPRAELLWASVREVLNIFQADAAGTDIVTVPHPILKKALELAGRDLAVLSLETVQMFANDAAAAGYEL
jgi:transaldolase